MQTQTKMPDIYFTPEYQELFKDTAFGGEPCHFSAAGVDYRFYRRPIAGTPYLDIVSPYGYSGPVINNNKGYWHTFAAAFMNYCEGYGVIAEFARLNPYIVQTLPYGEHHYEHDIFYIDLTKSENEIWKGFDKGCRSAIKDENVVFAHGVPQLVRRFYEFRMSQLKADGYEFDELFFNKLSSMDCVACFYNENAGIIILRYGDYAHYFLSGSIKPGQTNSLVWNAIKWAKAQGCKIFNLGGGLKEGDSLESFKRSFSHDSKPFYTYRRTHNLEVYNQICASKGIDQTRTDYYPAYRSENR